VAAHHVQTVQHRFVFELGWRECFRHVWAQHGAGILQSLHPSPLPGEAYARELPNDIRQGTIGALAQSGQPMAEITPTR
jgi:deoxyribodipyrimidine photo-lyase